MFLGDILENLAKKSDIDTKSADWQKVTAAIETVKADLPDTINTAFGNLLNLDEAKNNSAIRAHIKAENLDPFNNMVKKIGEKYGIDADTLKALDENPSTYKRIELLIEKFADLKDAQIKGAGKGDKADLEKKINELAAELSKAAQDKADSIKQVTSQYENEFTEMQIQSVLGSKELPGQFDKAIETKIAREFLNKKLSEKGAVIMKKDGQLILVSKEDANQRIFDNGKELNLDTLTNMALAENKFLKVSGGGGGTPPATTPNGGASAPNHNTATAQALADLDAAMAGLQ